eukprot:g76153.t1
MNSNHLASSRVVLSRSCCQGLTTADLMATSSTLASGETFPTSMTDSQYSPAPVQTDPGKLAPLSFAQDMWDGIDLDMWDGIDLVASRSEAGRKQMSRVSVFMKDKAKLDLQYANSLKKLIAKAEFSTGEDSSAAFLLAFDGLTQTFAVNQEIFAARIIKDVNKPLEDMVNDQDSQLKRIAMQ